MFNKYFNQAYYETTGDMEFYPEYYEVSADSTNTKWEVITSDAETVSDGQIKLSDIVNTRPCEAQNIVEGDYVSLKTDNHYRFITAGNTKYMMLIFKPITDSVTIDGVATYFDYGTQELGDVNGTDGIDVRDLVRTVSHLEDSTVAIKAYNADINQDKKIDKEDTSALRGKLLK